MADKRGYNGFNGSYPYAPYGGGYGAPSSGKKKLSKKDRKRREAKARRKAYNATMRERQRYAMENASYRYKIAAIDGRGGIDNGYYTLPADKKPRREKDYFFVMRKFVCFLMLLIMLVSVAYFALNFVKIESIPANFPALFIETEKKAADNPEGGENTGEGTEGGEEVAPTNADETTEGEPAEGEPAEGEPAEGEGEEEKAPAFDGIAYGAFDPVFGFLKYVGGKVGIDLDFSDTDFGKSPLYDGMIAKMENGMTDTLTTIFVYAMPIAIIVYIITALIMAIKAFIGMCGRRICKCFGLGSIVMIICAALVAFGGLASTVDVAGTMEFGNIVNILIGGLTGVGGFTGGYGLLIILVLPILTLVLSMFARKKIPYSIFDTFGE